MELKVKTFSNTHLEKAKLKASNTRDINNIGTKSNVQLLTGSKKARIYSLALHDITQAHSKDHILVQNTQIHLLKDTKH